ncbi:MAG: DUF3578 domain-containing protein [Candidatus Eremiobacteraeota bacterium]|nr:DUF3578 domain-containing protein [Candidatus Eremiobacteraeota bacterium]
MLVEIIDNYPANKSRRSDVAPNKTWFGLDAPNAVRASVDTSPYKVKASAGMGQNAADVPWVGIRREEITQGFRGGVYVVYLFPTNRGGVVLSLNQGITNVFEPRSVDYHPRAAGVFELRRRRDGLRALLDIPPRFSVGNISLYSKTERGRQYEDGHICGIFYARAQMPSEETLTSDLTALLALYETYAPSLLEVADLADRGNDSSPAPERTYIRGRQAQSLTAAPSDVDLEAWRQALERRTRSHRLLLDRVAAAAEAAFLPYRQTTHIDLLVDRRFIVEAKSLRGDDTAQSRAALAQLYYYKFIYRERYFNPELLAVFDAEPAGNLAIFLLKCGIHVLWATESGFTGPEQSRNAIRWLR